MSLSRLFSAAGALAATSAMLLSASTAAASAVGTLTFEQPTGTVGATDSIPVYLDFTLGADSVPLHAVNGLILEGGPTDDQLTTAGFDLSKPHNSYLNLAFYCTNTFTASCSSGPPYDFQYGPIWNLNMDLQPGETLSHILFGTFVPSAGAVAPGTYRFYKAELAIFTQGTHVTGGGSYSYEFSVASTCPVGDNSCAFTRTVASVPEPGAWALMILGFGGAGAALRRRTRSAAAAKA